SPEIEQSIVQPEQSFSFFKGRLAGADVMPAGLLILADLDFEPGRGRCLDQLTDQTCCRHEQHQKRGQCRRSGQQAPHRPGISTSTLNPNTSTSPRSRIVGSRYSARKASASPATSPISTRKSGPRRCVIGAERGATVIVSSGVISAFCAPNCGKYTWFFSRSTSMAACAISLRSSGLGQYR